MAIRNIIKAGDPGLNKVCRPVKEINAHVCEILDDMLETMRAANGVGLAAPQVGILRRIVVIEVDDRVFELINPEIIEEFSWQLEEEGCLSVPGLVGKVKRPGRVKARALDRNGVMHEYVVEDLLARAFCHEIDHLDGILYTSKATEVRDINDIPEDEEEETETAEAPEAAEKAEVIDIIKEEE